MSVRNLALIFGPTLLHSSTPEGDTKSQTLEQLLRSKGPHEVVVQSSILYAILELRAVGSLQF